MVRKICFPVALLIKVRNAAVWSLWCTLPLRKWIPSRNVKRQSLTLQLLHLGTCAVLFHATFYLLYLVTGVTRNSEVRNFQCAKIRLTWKRWLSPLFRGAPWRKRRQKWGGRKRRARACRRRAGARPAPERGRWRGRRPTAWWTWWRWWCRAMSADCTQRGFNRIVFRTKIKLICVNLRDPKIFKKYFTYLICSQTQKQFSPITEGNPDGPPYTCWAPVVTPGCESQRRRAVRWRRRGTRTPWRWHAPALASSCARSGRCGTRALLHERVRMRTIILAVFFTPWSLRNRTLLGYSLPTSCHLVVILSSKHRKVNGAVKQHTYI